MSHYSTVAEIDHYGYIQAVSDDGNAVITSPQIKDYNYLYSHYFNDEAISSKRHSLDFKLYNFDKHSKYS